MEIILMEKIASEYGLLAFAEQFPLMVSYSAEKCTKCTKV
jgi:hypothetical protein